MTTSRGAGWLLFHMATWFLTLLVSISLCHENTVASSSGNIHQWEPFSPVDHAPQIPHNNYSVVHLLMWKLFSQYHKAATIRKPLVVSLDVLLIKVKGTVEKEGIFETVIALFIRWHDERLKWNPSEFGNLTSLSLDADQVGLPDIAVILLKFDFFFKFDD